jgi:hypothetical protein
VDAIGRLYFNNNQHIANRNDLDIAGQIVINSGIAMDKYWIFKIATWIVLLGMVSIFLVSMGFFLF